jgi:glutamate synthase domain-containing protein 3
MDCRSRIRGPVTRRHVVGEQWHAGMATQACQTIPSRITLRGTAGQSFGAWVAKGVTLDLIGEGNDYVGKGLSGGGILMVRPIPKSPASFPKSIIVGNTVLYGAISGECYFRGVAGERFAVRNSGAIRRCRRHRRSRLRIHDRRDRGCAGQTGRNFAAGMSGGIAYVLDEAGDFKTRCNLAMVDLEPVAGRRRASPAASPTSPATWKPRPCRYSRRHDQPRCRAPVRS